MEILNKLLTINPNYLMIGLLSVVYTMERVFVMPYKFDKRHNHLLHNILFQVVLFIINLFYASIFVFCFNWFNEHQIGLFYIIQVPLWLNLFLGVVLFDFTTYWFHRLGHIVPFLWRFHRVHHSDTTMDVSTYFRQHPLEPLVNFNIGNIAAAAIFGLDLMNLGVYTLVVLPFLFIQHANLKTPDWVDTTFGKVLMTPNLHKIHHEQDQFYTDSNYADIFILWDRLFGTYTYKNMKDIKLGLKEFDSDKKQTFWFLMITPFIKIKRE